MTSVLATALGGMSRNLRGIDVAANNIANVNTEGYRTQRSDAAAGASAGSAPDANLSSPDLEAATSDVDLPASDVDLAAEFVQLKLHEIGYQANGMLVEVADRLIKDTLDLLA